MKTITNGEARQGDVWLVQLKALPKGLVPMQREGGRVVLAHGEVTGHAHAISDKHVRQFRAADGAPTVDGAGVKLRAGTGHPAISYLEVVGEPCALMHEEHETIVIPPGVYAVPLQREYVRGEIQRVAD